MDEEQSVYNVSNRGTVIVPIHIIGKVYGSSLRREYVAFKATRILSRCNSIYIYVPLVVPRAIYNEDRSEPIPCILYYDDPIILEINLQYRKKVRILNKNNQYEISINKII
jgi:hypothetical protein